MHAYEYIYMKKVWDQGLLKQKWTVRTQISRTKVCTTLYTRHLHSTFCELMSRNTQSYLWYAPIKTNFGWWKWPHVCLNCRSFRRSGVLGGIPWSRNFKVSSQVASSFTSSCIADRQIRKCIHLVQWKQSYCERPENPGSSKKKLFISAIQWVFHQQKHHVR